MPVQSPPEYQLAFVIHGQVRPETARITFNLRKKYPDALIIGSFWVDDRGKIDRELFDKIVYSDDVGSNERLGFVARNYFRHCKSFLEGCKLVQENCIVVKVRSDVEIIELIFPQHSHNVYVYPYFEFGKSRWFNGDMIFVSNKTLLEKIFKQAIDRRYCPFFEKKCRLPGPLASKPLSIMSPEEVFYTSIFRANTDKAVDGALETKELLSMRQLSYGFMSKFRKLEIQVVLPDRIANYFHSPLRRMVHRFNRNILFSYFYRLARGIK